MEKPLISITTKDFLTGIAPGAFLNEGQLFYKADGVTPLIEAGTSRSAKNGLLMAGGQGTAVSGSTAGNFISYTTTPIGSSQNAAFFGTASNHILKLVLNSTVSNSITDIHTCSNTLVQGLEVLATAGGNINLFYFQTAKIGLYDFSSFNDTWASISTDYIHCTHRYFDSILYGNGTKIGKIVNDGGTSFTNTASALKIPQSMMATDISDDGTYAVIAVTDNVSCDTSTMADTRVLFWDGYSVSWNFEFPIPDPFIYAVEKTPLGVFAFGVTGIWQLSIKGCKKVFSRATGLYSVNSDSSLLYGRMAASYFGEALMWGGSSGSNNTVKSLGKLQSDAPNAYLHPFLTTANKNITLVAGQVVKGYVLVADDSPALVAYPFTSPTPQTGVSAQTVYFPVPAKASIKRIEVVFGGPLASGDSLAVSVYKDEDTASVSYGSATFANDGAIRRKQLIPTTPITVEDQFSLLITFTAGAPKIKTIHVYSDIENV